MPLLQATWKSRDKRRQSSNFEQDIAHSMPAYIGSKDRPQNIIFQMKVKTEKLSTNILSADAILDDPKAFPYFAQYILDTGRSDHLCSYLPQEE
ncbi:hypothetical protein CROQUDRAFT_94642 [Cronartium quercuum f. sp. fusiforme G11]|uniref:Uncharacterized protein n=1 Tax=Cronartium quercuum f. sp. fusiforme G11 TaxID=708437 RepID=A0A9P6NDI6_9BASI|nr:hypothetical protein CROQUDRAFT_94642 [Cronartium quercuum f. sp. fusiforme G11]